MGSSQKLSSPLTGSQENIFENNDLLQTDDDKLKNDEETIAHDYVSLPKYNYENDDFLSQESYGSQTQTQTQRAFQTQTIVKFVDDQWAIIKRLDSQKGNDLYLTLPEMNYYFGRNTKNCDYVIKGKFVSNKHFKIMLKKHEITNQFFVELENKSRNGTLVNSVVVNNSIPLSNKDIISVKTDDGEICELMIYINSGINNKTNIIDMKYEFKEIIGSGAFSTVKSAIRRDNCQPCAIKIIDSKRFYFNEKIRSGFKREIEILKRIDHENVLKFYEYLVENEKIYIVTEVLNGGNLTSLISSKKGLTEMESRKLFKQILEGMKYLHDKNIIHRDIKPDNILLKIEKYNSSLNESYSESADTDENFNVVAKIGDFGLAKYENNGLQTVCGTPQYLAPEIMDESAVNKYYDSKVDCWSLGIVLFQMISNELPHKSDKSKINFSNFKWTRVTFSVIQLIENLLIVNKEKRYSVDEALNHEWFTMTNDEIINDPYLTSKLVENWGVLTIEDKDVFRNIKMDLSIFLIGANKRCNICKIDSNDEKIFSQLHIVFYYEDGTVYFVDKSAKSNTVFLNDNIVDKNKSIILNEDCVIKMVDSDERKYRLDLIINPKSVSSSRSSMHASSSNEQLSSYDNDINTRKRKYSNNGNNNIERAKRSSTIKLLSEVKTKISVEYNENSKLESSLANLSISEDIWLELISINKMYPNILLKESKIQIGRCKECLILIDSLIISNFHAVIERRSDGKVVFHDKSSNGSFIDHIKIKNKSVLLKNNTKIIFIYKNYKEHKDDNNVEVGYIVSLK